MTAANPSVDRYLIDKSLDHIDHALGRPVFPLKESYRNYFATDLGGSQAAAFGASPHWEMSGCHGNMAYFAVTDAGRQALGQYLARHPGEVGGAWRAYEITFNGVSRILPAKNRRAARYACFLDVSDSRPDLTFIDFARQVKVRRIAA